MVKFFYRVFSVLFIVVLIDISVGSLSYAFITHIPNANILQTDACYALNKITPDILIVGASRAKHSFNSEIIKDSMQMSVYNGGLDGHEILYQRAVVKSVIDRNPPKIIVLDVSPNQLNGFWKGRLVDVHHFYYTNKYMKESINMMYDKDTDHTKYISSLYMRKLLNGISQLKYHIQFISSLYTYNNTFPWFIQALIIGNVHDSLCGFRPLPYKKDRLELVNDTSTFKFMPTEYEAFIDIIKICKQKRIKLILTYCPGYIKDTSNFNAVIKRVAKKYNVQYYSYVNSKYYLTHPKLFKDNAHLNEKGAYIYSKSFIHYMRK